MDFSNYSAKDLVLNESFQKWILDPDEETNAFWNDWITRHPHKTEIIDEAKALIQQIRSIVERNVACDAEEVWNRITKNINK